MAGRHSLVLIVLLAAPRLVLGQDRYAPLLDSARSALQTGQTEAAIRLAEQYAYRVPRDARGYVVLGDAYMQRMPAGRFAALRAYEDAERAAPNDPEPFYKYAQAGIFLGGDDGEAIARRGLERVLELDPLYQQAWTQWLLVFRNQGSRRRMRERLASHDRVPEIRARIALLDIEDELYPAADSLLDGLIASDSTNVEWLAWRAESAFETGNAGQGAVLYARALANAANDSSGALWRQAIGIAHPDEIRAFDRVRPEQREAWLAGFWARREPNMFAGVNRRLLEHFQRLRYARRVYPLLHPLVSYHRSQLARALNLEPARGERDFYSRCEMYEVQVPAKTMFTLHSDTGLARAPLPGVSSAQDRARMSQAAYGTLTDAEADAMPGPPGGIPMSLRTMFVPINLDLRSVDTTAARLGYNLATGLDDRGVLYLRFGAPRALRIGGRNDADPQCHTIDVETWHYDEIGDVRFARPSAFSRGERTVSEMVFRSMNETQFQGLQQGITRDESSVPAPLEFGVWTAQFAGGRSGSTDVVVVSTRGALAAALVGATENRGDVRESSDGAVTIPSPPGRYALLAHADDSSRLGRQELGVEVRRFAPASLSDLLLAPTWEGAQPTRAEMLEQLRRTLTFPEGQTIRSYAEVYGLAAEGGIVRYHVDYALLRSSDLRRDYGREDWSGATHFTFDREQPSAGGATREVLDIDPARLPRGRYLLALRVTGPSGRGIGRSVIAFEVR